MPNFSDYIDTNKFAIKPHTSTAPTFGYENPKSFHRVTDSSDKFIDDSFKHKAGAQPMQQKPLPTQVNLGNPAPERIHLKNEPFGCLGHAFPSFERSWQPKYIEQAYTNNIVGKTQDKIKHDVQISHARDPVNGGEPRKDIGGSEWAQELIDSLGLEELQPSVRKMETKRREIARQTKYRKTSATPSAPIVVQPVSSVLTSSPSSSQKKISGAIVTPKPINNQVNTVASGVGETEEDNNSFFPASLFTPSTKKYFSSMDDNKKTTDHDLLTKTTTKSMPEEEITKSIFGFTPLKLQKEITKLQEQVEKQEEKLSNPKLVPSQGKQIRDKIKIMKDSIETKTEALAVKNVKHSEEWRTVTTEDKDFFSSVQEQLENQKSVPDGLIENINTNLKKKGFTQKIKGNVKKSSTLLSALMSIFRKPKSPEEFSNIFKSLEVAEELESEKEKKLGGTKVLREQYGNLPTSSAVSNVGGIGKK